MTNTKTYVLAGYDHNNALKEERAAWHARAKDVGDVVVIYPKKGETMEELASRIKPPANIIMAAHGGKDGSFTWDKESSYYYSDFFRELPSKGITSITVTGCYGESAVKMANSLPQGTLLQSVVGAKVQGVGGSVSERIGKEIASYDTITPLSIMLEALDGTDPKLYKEWDNESVKNNAANSKKLKKDHHTPLNPNDVLPHTIAIGGLSSPLDLNDRMAVLSARGKKHNINEQTFSNAIDAVKDHFDPSDADIKINGDKINEWIGDKTGFYFGKDHKISNRIDAVADKLRAGADTSKFTLEEKRIGYALTIAELHESGEIKKMVTLAKKPKEAEIVWGGKGDETIAKIQAIVEKVWDYGTDKGGARDNRVDGIRGALTDNAITQLSDRYHVKSEEALLNKLLHDKDIMRAFGSIKGENGEEVAAVMFKPHSADKPHGKGGR